MLVTVAGVGCRSHEEVCDETTCGNDAVGGGAGAPGMDGSEPSGAAGAAPEPECRVDLDCANDSTCDGVERCVRGQCEDGEVVACDHGTGCVEAGRERCVYEVPSPWLLVTGTDSLRGLPVAELGKRDLITLVDRPREEVLQGFERVFWPADGKVALVRSFEREFGYRLELLRFGAGVPGPIVPLPDVPNWGDFYEAPRISRDSTRALVVDGYGGVYLVDLTEAATPTRLVAPPNAVSSVEFCSDSSSWLQQASNTSLWSQAWLADDAVETRELADGWPGTSPDGRWVALELLDDSDETVGVQLFACSYDSWSVDYPEARNASFSSDSQLLLLQLAGGGVQVFSLENPSKPVELWSDLEASDWQEPGFFAGPQGPVVGYLKAEDDSLRFVDPFTGAEVPDRVLPPNTELAAAGASSMLLWSTDTSGAQRDLLWHSLTPNVPPVLVLSDPNDEVTKIWRCPPAPDSVLLTRRLPGADQTELLFLRFDGERAELGQLEPLMTVQGTISSVDWAPDGWGAAVATQGALIDNTLYWVPWSAEGPGKPVEIAEKALTLEFQPWP
jgi:hypothetical protein